MKPVLAVWVDAVSEDSWTDLPEAKDLELHTIHTLGFLFHEDERRILIAANWDVDRDGVSQYIAIPKSWLIQITPLEVEI